LLTDFATPERLNSQQKHRRGRARSESLCRKCLPRNKNQRGTGNGAWRNSESFVLTAAGRRVG
jgi:hypothetical protein